MEELVSNLHLHTVYSDGNGTHADLAAAAFKAGLDVVIVTDHNVLVGPFEKILQQNGRTLLMLVGQEVHDQARDPQKNHTLVIGANRDLATFARSPQTLIDKVAAADGLSFLAHPFESALALFHETDITWVDWQVKGFTGMELWNGLSELKSVIHNPIQALFYAFFPHWIAHGPPSEAVQKWDELTSQGARVVAVGGADAHALNFHAGPIQRVIFPYEFHFRAINTHLLTPRALSGDLAADRRMVLEAFRLGHCFIGYDLPASTRGFRFTAQGRDETASMGDEIRLNGGITFQVRLPEKVECRLIRNGVVVKTWKDREICSYLANLAGVYRIECYVEYLGRKRGWIFSNPIYVR